ncbi:MAG TPA: DUF4388 domain-containing protein [Pyrinomonadaceae bacterium]
MQSTNFVVLTGHLNDYPLADLIGILRHQRKTGRLLVEYTLGPCSFYFLEGNLVDAQLNTLSGLHAVLVALSQPNAAFNFNPLIEPPRRSINESSQRVILELLGCWEEKTVEVEARKGNGHALPPVVSVEALPAETGPEMLPAAREVRALPPSPLERASRRRQQRILIASAVISLLVSFITVAALMRWMVKRDIAAALSEMTKKQELAGGKSEPAASSAQTVKVVVRVENGRISQAFVEEHRAGLEAYEALALRIARGRRYAARANGQDTIPIKINSPK